MLRTRIPLFLMAGRAPFSTAGELTGTKDMYVHFIQEPFDQGSLVRPYVKWEWTLPSGIIVKETLRRGQSIMQSEPKGPVYLMMSRETLCETWSDDSIASTAAGLPSIAEPAVANADAVDRLASRLMTAQRPVIVTSYGGRTPGTSDAMHDLAEFAGIAIVESNLVSNVSNDRPCFIGAEAAQFVPEADVGLLIDVDVPWFPRDSQKFVLGSDRRRCAQVFLADVGFPCRYSTTGQFSCDNPTGPRSHCRTCQQRVSQEGGFKG
jgi:acetolactate synthase-1/2/3 large subunit